ncbi:hypothetical protein [Haladaptatus halobius]|jgi:hypothetical protein|uniref:hypothetical protein n=1 Tax=Haladaptatus halobius TaxID=2884875 RepID=UPI001D0A1791|nr:hypothetical protein [Haladaptatus halobius]
MTDAATAGTDDYSGLLGAFRYSFRASDSLAFRLYVFVSFVLGSFLAIIFVLALVFWFTEVLGQSALRTTSNAFLGVIALFVLGPLFAPVLFVARRHRRGETPRPAYDTLLALAGFVFVVSLYVGIVITVPPEYQSPNPGAVGGFLYSLPQLYGLVPPLVATLLIFALHRLAR